jgi:site-specific recombinase XerD
MGRPRTGWSLRDPKPGRQHYTVRFTDRAGTPREYTTGESDPQEAAKRAAEIYARDLTAAATPGPRINPHLALDEHMSQWLASIDTTHDPKTVVTYTAYARRFLSFFGNSLARVTVPRMGDYQRKRLGEVTRKTLLKERSAFNGFLDWAVEQGLLAEEHRPRWPRLPKKALGVRSGPQRETPVDVTPAQVNAFLAALPTWSRPNKDGVSFAVRARFEVMYETGLRPATLDELAVPRHWRPGATEILLEDKIDKARFGRRIPISARCAEALERTVLALGLSEGLIFGAHDYRYAVNKAAAAAGLPEDFAPYDLRHGRAGHLLDAGATMRAVAHLLGHRKLTTTDRYLRAQELDARAALDAVSIGGQSGDRRGLMQGSERPIVASVEDHGAKEEGRTPTVSLPLEPESGESVDGSSTYGGLSGQEGTNSDRRGQVIGDAPETTDPDSVAVAARYLSVLRAQWDALDDALSDELITGDEPPDSTDDVMDPLRKVVGP